MQVFTYPTNAAMSLECATIFADFIRAKPDALCCFAAGQTQVETYRILGEWVQKGELDLSRIRVVGMDDMVGTRRENREGFRYFLDVHFFKSAKIQDSQVTYVNAAATDLDAECARITKYLTDHGPIDFILLGIGLNGHIGYNEPGSPIDGRTHVVDLTDSSLSASTGYFDHAVDSTQGITLGLGDILAARTIVVQASGSKKAGIVRDTVQSDINPNIPSTYLKNRPDSRLYLDADAAKEL